MVATRVRTSTRLRPLLSLPPRVLATSWVPALVVLLGAVAVASVGAPLVAVALAAVVCAGVFLAAFRRRPVDVVVGVWAVTIVENLLSAYVPGELRGVIKAADEPLVAMALIGTLLYHRHRSATARVHVLLPLALLLYVGWASVALNGVDLGPALLGTWQGVKFWTLLYIVVQLPWTTDSYERALRWLCRIAAVVIALAAVEYVVPGPFARVFPVVSEGAEVRFGRLGLQSVFTHAGHFGSFATIFATVFLGRFVGRGDRRMLVAAGGSIVLALLSLRLKVILGFVGAVSTMVLVSPTRFARRAGVAVLAGAVAMSLAGGIVFDLAVEQVNRYMLTDETTTVREALYSTAARIGADEAPFGRGFGQFGTGAATTYESPVYDEYGLSSRPGLSQELPAVRHDTTWPTVLGETGYIGLAAFLGGLAAIGRRLLRQARSSGSPALRTSSLIGVSVLAAAMFESVGRPSFYAAVTSITVALLVGAPLVLGARDEAVGSSPLRKPLRDPQRDRELSS